MKKIEFTTDINASSNKVWQVLWFNDTYRKWASVFHEGSNAISDWTEGHKIHFTTLTGDGMYSIIEKNIPNELMSFKHIGILKNFKEEPNNEETKSWSGAIESYQLKDNNGSTILNVNLDVAEEYIDYFKKTFPQALAIVKTLSENKIIITVTETVNSPIEKVWEFWTSPQHIVNWNTASVDWRTSKAENNVTVGGKFSYHMEAKDGSFGFDFEGSYTTIENHKTIKYTLDDSRKVNINFSSVNGSIEIIQSFEAEDSNTLELQKTGWQAIMDNFKKYTENN